MGKKVKMLLLVLAVGFLLGGCSLLTLEELYCLPKRSEDYENLQSLIDDAMENLTYSAPLSGDNRQSVQTADLDGDGSDEYLLFAKDGSENPLKILIFSQVASGYVLMDTIEGYGFAFEFVEYQQMDDKEGLEIVVGRQVSEELPRSVCVYRFTSGYARQLLSTSYTGLICEDLDADGLSELLLLTDGVSERGDGMAVLYTYKGGMLQRSFVSNLSMPISYFQQVNMGVLGDGSPAVYVTSTENNQSLVVDVFAFFDHAFVNLAGDIHIPAIHNYFIYPEDIDEDGMVEIPRPITMQSSADVTDTDYIIEWYVLSKNGEKKIKSYTYHNHADGWYLVLDSQWISEIVINNEDNRCVFYLRDSESEDMRQLCAIYTLTGSDRESESQLEGRILLFKGDSIIYVAEMAEIALEYPNAEELLLKNFHPIRKEWNTEESGD